MPHLITRVLTALLAVAGLLCAAVGLWFMTQLGSDGRATFRAQPGEQVVVLGPNVINRVESPVDLQATTADGSPVWLGAARPSDAESVIEGAPAMRATGVSVPGWTLETATASGEGQTSPQSYDLWQDTRTGTGSVAMTLNQAAAPQTVVIAAAEGQTVDEVTLSVADQSWFTTAVVLTLGGLLLLGVAAYLLLRTLRPRRDTTVKETD
ncbi:hypothetical protein GCM10022199_14360 [Marihabitans asiaticum]|uniref:Uncharacterized protein n=1 Tax=Marihabitans asiaticum TaxID=415218 RepID=A0A560W8D2_9MICO|nr:hypothetical protein [Marihabitans asiaticum]TWD13868.1 hypothetical protein FB557_2510 [Marihabitans asiaticum]